MIHGLDVLIDDVSWFVYGNNTNCVILDDFMSEIFSFFIVSYLSYMLYRPEIRATNGRGKKNKHKCVQKVAKVSISQSLFSYQAFDQLIFD